MTTYQPTSEQEKAIREWLQEAIVPLIEQVLVKKLGQAMSFAAQEVIKPQRPWVGLTDEEIKLQWSEFWETDCHAWSIEFAKAIEAKLKEKNT